ncbi:MULTISPECIES: ATP-binding protein [unclassified Streptomyces]|uniref:ATP-binding protein n=1 Tax=unclassified Streptomyces TaxID=2593676 RepID=UPI002E281C05|nr:ATP-binding protein [Streptomyces sp. NBC_01423]WSX92122.1 ATP-binding protein [Streptomyces sp. NBC_00891]WSY06599.1 ATP-binding protein [Streptomyces sp. NBC_00890]WSZ08223.1 ATP-binding protein [Streptomyces sp. NBC_00869]WSZ24278.1 ATP-binding protein [Streptomyces sp. NBC_00870]
MSIWWSLHLRRDAASVPLARRFLLGTMESAGVDPDISFDLSLALSEACANAVEHGGEYDGTSGSAGEGRDAWDEPSATASGQYRVTAYLDGEKCRIEVADSGPGFPTAGGPHSSKRQPGTGLPDPQYASYPPVTAEEGRGLCLIEQLADHVHFGNRPGCAGAVVSFDKVLKRREGALLMVS